MRPAIEAVRETGTAVAEVALCYTGDLSNPDEKLYTLDYYLGLAERIVDAGAHVLAIKDMAGLLRAPAARTLVTALRERFDLPVHLHTHDTPGGQLATLLAAIDAGVDAVDAATASMAGTTSQPPLSALVVATDHTDRETGLSPRRGLRARALLGGDPPGLRAVRVRAARRRPGASTPTRSRAASSPTCASRRSRSGLGEKFEQIEDMYAAANDILGNIVKVTPSSKVVGDLALHLVAVGADPAEFAENPAKFDIPDSVIGFLTGELGDPPGGWPEPFRTKALAGRTWKAPVEKLTEEQAEGLAGSEASRRRTLNELLFAGPTQEFTESRETYGDVSVLPTTGLPLRPAARARSTRSRSTRARRLILGLQAIGEPDERGFRTVMATINGQLRPISVRDRVGRVRGRGRGEGRHLQAAATWPPRSTAW